MAFLSQPYAAPSRRNENLLARLIAALEAYAMRRAKTATM